MALPDMLESGLSLVVTGTFKPTTVTPGWLLANRLVGEAQHANQSIDLISSELSKFSLGSLSIIVNTTRIQMETPEPDDFESTRDVLIGILTNHDNAAAAYVGINRHVHFQVYDEDRWHLVGDSIQPKSVWDGVLIKPGLKSVNVQGFRPDGYRGQVYVQVEPSSKIKPNGVYVAVNDHYGLERDTNVEPVRGLDDPLIEASADKIPVAVKILSEHWESSMARADTLVERVYSLSKGEPR